MRIHILSDLHNEFSKYDMASPDADVIILAGDIDYGFRGIAWARLCWPEKEIVFVPGNHEYYNSEIGRVNDELAKAGKVYGVHVLNPGTVKIAGVRFVGAALWTDFKLFGQMEETVQMVQVEAMNCMNDFRCIDYGEGTFSPVHAAQIHQRDLNYIRRQLNAKFIGATVVVTHHLPSMRSVSEQYKRDPMSASFASNLDNLMGKCSLWIHGHTHDSFDYEHPMGARVVCNPRGYSEYAQVAKNGSFDPQLIVDV